MQMLFRHVTILACAAALAGCRPLSSHPLAVEAAAELGRNPRVAEVLGRPVARDSRVRGTANETDGIAALTFSIKGPKGSGVVAVEGKKTQGTWGITFLELQPAGAAGPLALTADIATDTPKFDPTAATTSPAPPAAPPGDVEITLPPGPSP
jgi:hypothetical protein